VAWRHGSCVAVCGARAAACVAGGRIPERHPESQTTFVGWRESVLNDIEDATIRDHVKEALSSLDPNRKTSPDDLPSLEWQKPPPAKDRKKRLAALFTNLACSEEAASFIARSLLRSGVMSSVGEEISAFAEQLRMGKTDPTECPSVMNFREEDWAALNRTVAQVLKKEADEQAAARR
jgi:hypothetical protein